MRNRDSLGSLFPYGVEGIELSDFLVRLDLIGNLASANQVELSTMLRRTWLDMFPKTPQTADLLYRCGEYFEKYRLGYKLLSVNDDIQKSMIILKIASATTVLLCLSQSEGDSIRPALLAAEAFDMLRSAIGDDAAVGKRIKLVMKEYFSFGARLSPETFQLLCKNSAYLKRMFDRLYTALSAKWSAAPPENKRQSSRRTQAGSQEPSVLSLRDPFDFARAVCFLCAALPKQGETNAREEAIREHWKHLFPEIEYSDRVKERFDQALIKTPFLSQLNWLFRYSIQDVPDELVSRMIVLCLCVNQVLANLAHNASTVLVIDEAMELFEQFDVLSLGNEELDIKSYLNRLGADSGRVNEDISLLFWNYSGDISYWFRETMRGINSKEGVRRRYWESRLGEKNRRLEDLQKQVDSAKISTLYSIVEKMSSPEYDFMLSRVYRFAYGFDALPEDQLRALLKRFFQILRLFGVQSTMTDGIGKPLSFAWDQGSNIIVEPIHGMQDGCIVFPGWRVSDNTVLLPVGCDKRQGVDLLSSSKE